MNVSAHELHAQLVADVYALLSVSQQSFYVRRQHADERPVWRNAGDDGIEYFPNAAGHGNGRQHLRYLALNFARRVLLDGAIAGNGREVRVRIRGGLACEHSLDQSLREQV